MIELYKNLLAGEWCTDETRAIQGIFQGMFPTEYRVLQFVLVLETQPPDGGLKNIH